MAALQKFEIAHLPPNLVAHVALFEEVENAAYLHQQLLQGNPEFEYALIDAACILSPTHVLAAIFRASNDYLNGRMKSKNVHSEIVFALSPNNNIAASFRTFGITPSTKTLLVIKLNTNPNMAVAEIEKHLNRHVEGKQIDFEQESLAKLADIPRVKKAYKLQSTKPSKQREDQKDDLKELEILVLGMMALRGAN